MLKSNGKKSYKQELLFASPKLKSGINGDKLAQSSTVYATNRVLPIFAA